MNSISGLLLKCAPAIFVVLWATGFVAAKFGTIDSEPLIFLFVRFVITFAILAIGVLIIFRPKGIPISEFAYSIFIGMLIHGIYLGGVFFAVSKGMPAGISALIVSLQPFFTTVFAFFILGERIIILRLMCFVFALVGIVLVLFPTFEVGNSIGGVTALTFSATVVSTVAISFGAVVQKKVVRELNLWLATTAQFIGAALVAAIGSFILETQYIVFTANTVWTLVWLILVLSIGAVALLMFLIRRGSSSSVSSLFFLVPVVAMFMTWILFDETLNAMQIVGSLIVVASVAMSSKVDHDAPKKPA